MFVWYVDDRDRRSSEQESPCTIPIWQYHCSQNIQIQERNMWKVIQVYEGLCAEKWRLLHWEVISFLSETKTHCSRRYSIALQILQLFPYFHWLFRHISRYGIERCVFGWWRELWYGVKNLRNSSRVSCSCVLEDLGNYSVVYQSTPGLE